MTKKDYELVAGALERAKPAEENPVAITAWWHAVVRVADAFQATNPRFQRDRFYRAVAGMWAVPAYAWPK